MPKKILFAVLIVISLFLCSSAVNKAITYDNDFIISLAKGLDKRWEDAHSNYEDTTAYYEKAHNLSYRKLEDTRKELLRITNSRN